MSDSRSTGATPAYPSPLYAWSVVAILVIACMLSYVNRQVVAIVLEPMKTDLGLTDTMISLLYSSFAASYALAGLPLARWADTYNRKWLITGGMVVWSVMSVVSGLTRQYLLVFMARIGLGAGEAILTPATNSMAGDLFPRHRIPLALSVFQTGAIMGSAIAFIIGGAALQVMQDLSQHALPLVGRLAPWQLTFVVVGMPGFALSIVLLFLREPIRRNLAGMTAPARKGVPLSEIAAFYRRNWRTLVFHHIGFLAFSLAGFAFVFWTVAFFTRVHHVAPGEASEIFGWIFLIAGPAGVVWAGLLAGRFTRRGRRDANILAGLIGGALTIPVIILIQLMPNATWAFVLYAPALFFVNSPFGLAFGALPVITPAPMRAQVAAVYMLTASAGMAFGPVIAGAFNDHIFTGAQGVRYSMIALTAICGVIGIGCLMACRRHYVSSLDEADAVESATIP
ncbi:MAG: MFS transporter [Alphaproteobacteria bacterium]|nr:MFS transporter [Alphaproteobacteria bacterium]